MSVPQRWVPYEAFRGNAEGLDGSGTDQSKETRKLNPMSMRSHHTKSGLLVVVLLTAVLMTGCGNDSGAPQVAAPTALDTAPPAVPTGLAASAYNSRVKVAWLPNTTDGDFEGFMLYRLAFGQVWPLLDEPTTGTTYIDESPLHRPYSYAVTSIDAAGNESAWQEVYFSGIADLPDRDSLR